MKYALPCLMVLIVRAVGACNRVTASDTQAQAVALAIGTPGLSGGRGNRAERHRGGRESRSRQA